MADKLAGAQSKGENQISEVTVTEYDNKVGLDVALVPPGTGVDPRAKYVEADYTNDNKTVTFRYYESSSKATLYSTIVANYNSPQDTCFISAEWS